MTKYTHPNSKKKLRTTHSGLHSMQGDPYRRLGGQEQTAFRDPGREVHMAFKPPITNLYRSDPNSRNNSDLHGDG